jgi:hypothetical protein
VKPDTEGDAPATWKNSAPRLSQKREKQHPFCYLRFSICYSRAARPLTSYAGKRTVDQDLLSYADAPGPTCHSVQLSQAAKVAGYIAGIVVLEHSASPWWYATKRFLETVLGIGSAFLVSVVIPLLLPGHEEPASGEGNR